MSCLEEENISELDKIRYAKSWSMKLFLKSEHRLRKQKQSVSLSDY